MVAAYSLMILGNTAKVPADVVPLMLVMLGLGGVAHLANRVFAPDAVAVLLPIVFLLNGLGYVMIVRIDLGTGHSLRAAAGCMDRDRGRRVLPHPLRRPPVA